MDIEDIRHIIAGAEIRMLELKNTTGELKDGIHSKLGRRLLMLLPASRLRLIFCTCILTFYDQTNTIMPINGGELHRSGG